MNEETAAKYLKKAKQLLAKITTAYEPCPTCKGIVFDPLAFVYLPGVPDPGQPPDQKKSLPLLPVVCRQCCGVRLFVVADLVRTGGLLQLPDEDEA